MDNEKKLTDWLRKQFCQATPPTRLVLRSAPAGAGRGTDVETFGQDEAPELADLSSLAGTILARAQDDADGNGAGVARYAVFAYTDSERPTGRFTFRVRGEANLDFDDEEGSEAPNQRGLIAQLMRHNEAIMRLFVQSTGSVTSTMVRRLESSDRTNEQLMHERLENQKLLEAAQTEEHQRGIELMRVDGEQKRKDQVFQKMMGLLPVLVNRLAGVKAMPGGDDPLMMMLEPLIESMTTEQFQAIHSTLTPEQAITFFELMRTVQKRREAKKAGANGVKNDKETESHVQ